MPQSLLSSQLQLVSLHRTAITKLFVVDSGLLLLGCCYMFAPVSELSYSAHNGICLFLIIIAAVALNIRILRQNSGSIAFYRTIPLSGIPSILSAHVITLAPFLIASLSLAFIIAGVKTLFPQIQIPAFEVLALRTFQVIVVFVITKSYVVPTYILSTKHPMFLAGYYLLILPIIFIVMLMHELVWSHFSHIHFLDLSTLCLLFIALEIAIIAHVK
jgi:hypothetical protein